MCYSKLSHSSNIAKREGVRAQNYNRGQRLASLNRGKFPYPEEFQVMLAEIVARFENLAPNMKLRVFREGGLMFFWLVIVIITVFRAFRRARQSPKFSALFANHLAVLIGDTCHLIGDFAFFLSGTEEGRWSSTSPPIRVIALMLDLVVFVVFYLVWALWGYRRYTNGNMRWLFRATLAPLLVFGGTFASVVPRFNTISVLDTV